MRTLLLGLAAVVLLAGCDTATQDSAAPQPTTVAPTTVAPTASTPSVKATTAKPTPTPPAVTVDGACPYADTETVMDIIGQHLARTTVTKTTPHPGCAFYRPDAEKAAEVSVSVLPTAVAAQTQAVRLGGKGANPVNDVADGGTVAITDGGALLAVSKGTALVVIRINQQISLEAIELAKLVVAKV